MFAQCKTCRRVYQYSGMKPSSQSVLSLHLKQEHQVEFPEKIPDEEVLSEHKELIKGYDPKELKKWLNFDCMAQFYNDGNDNLKENED